LSVPLGALASRRDDGMNPSIGESTYVTARYSQIEAADFDIGHLFGFHDGVAHVFVRCRSIGNFTLADTARSRLAHTHNVKGAGRIDLSDDGTDLRSADFQPDNDG